MTRPRRLPLCLPKAFTWNHLAPTAVIVGLLAVIACRFCGNTWMPWSTQGHEKRHARPLVAARAGPGPPRPWLRTV